MCRFIAVARNCLLQGIFRIYIQDWPFMVLLLDGDARRDESLINRLRIGCLDAHRRPLVLGIGPDAQCHDRAADLLGADGLVYRAAGITSPEDCAAVWYHLSECIRALDPPPNSEWSVPASMDFAGQLA